MLNPVSTAGAVQTLMSVDADRVVNLCVSLHELWSLPAQIAIALYLLYTQVSPSTAQLACSQMLCVLTEAYALIAGHKVRFASSRLQWQNAQPTQHRWCHCEC